MMGVCFAAGGAVAVLAVQGFTLAWTHSIEKIRWEEDWRVQGRTLVITESRVRGSGAGMEVPEGAVLEHGVWHYRPRLAPVPKLIVARSTFTADYELCWANRCRSLGTIMPVANGPTEIFPCADPDPS